MLGHRCLPVTPVLGRKAGHDHLAACHHRVPAGPGRGAAPGTPKVLIKPMGLLSLVASGHEILMASVAQGAIFSSFI